MELDTIESSDETVVRLIEACHEGESSLVASLMSSHPLLANSEDDRGQTPLAAGGQHVDIVRLLLARGADPNRAGRAGWTPLHAACGAKHSDDAIRELLTVAPGAAAARNEDGNTPLHYLVRSSHSDALLLSDVVDVSEIDARNKGGETALLIAAWRDNPAAVMLLLAKGANARLPNNAGQTPLHAAALLGSRRSAELLLPASDPCLPDAQGRTADQLAEADSPLKRMLQGAREAEERAQRTRKWLHEAGVDARYHNLFVIEEFDVTSLKLVSDEVLRSMGLPAAVRVTVLHAARKSASISTSSNAANSSSPRMGNENGYGGLLSTDQEEESSSVDNCGGDEMLREELMARHVPVVERRELQVRHVIGRGFFATVRLCEWNGVRVAAKEINARPARADKGARQLFLQEVAIMARLRHPNVVQFLGVSLRSDGGPVILTEFMAGGTLFSAVRLLSWRMGDEASQRFFRVATDVCKGMCYLHSSAGVIHRDLTSKNVLLDLDFSARIADFGVSRLDSPDYLTLPVGALPYVAPEVYLHHRYSAAADVYSFGIILCETLTGR